MTMTQASQTIEAGKSFPSIGSQFPFPFEVVIVNPVKPEFTIRERIGYETVTRVAKVSVFVHAVTVRR